MALNNEDLEIGVFYWLYAKDSFKNKRRLIREWEVTIGKYIGKSTFGEKPIFYICGSNLSESLDDWLVGAKVR